MKKDEVLIVGINSFLGKAIYKLVKDKFRVVGIFNSQTNNVAEDVELIHTDSITKLENRKFKSIYLVSSYVPKTNNTFDDEKLVATNILLPHSVVALFPESRIIFCSSVSVYENVIGSKLISVDEPPSPSSKYALSKLWGEKIIEGHRSYAILRISSMYGVGMSNTTFIPRIIGQGLLNKEIQLFGEGERLQNYIHVDDVANIAVKSANQANNFTLLAVNDRSYTNKEIAETILELLPETTLSFSGEDNAKSNTYNNDFSHKMLGELEFRNIKEGLKELIGWIRKEF